MIRGNSVDGGGSGPRGAPPGLDMAMTVMAVVAAIGGAERFGLWPASLEGSAGTIVPAAGVVVLAGWRLAGRAGQVFRGVWTRRSRGRRAFAAGDEASHSACRADERGDAEANATVLAVHLPDPTMFPPAAANDDDKDQPTAV